MHCLIEKLNLKICYLIYINNNVEYAQVVINIFCIHFNLMFCCCFAYTMYYIGYILLYIIHHTFSKLVFGLKSK